MFVLHKIIFQTYYSLNDKFISPIAIFFMSAIIFCRSAEDKRQFVMAIKEATKLSSQPNISPRGAPVVPPKPRVIKDQNQNSNILPSRPNLLAGKMRRYESKCSEASKSSWARSRPRVNSDSDSSNNSVGIDSGVSFDGGSSARKNAARKKISNVF